MTLFDSDTLLTQIGEGQHQITFNQNWWIMAGPNGGLVAAQFAAAALAEVDDRPILTMTVHYVNAPAVGDATIRTTVDKRGRAVAFLTQRMEQDGRLLATCVVAMAAGRPSGFDWNHLQAPDVAPPELCPTVERGTASIPLRDRWDTRWTAGVPGRPSVIAKPGEIAVGGWTRLSEDQPLDQRVLAAMADAWIPPLMLHHTERFAAPTLELTIHFRTPLQAVATDPGAWCHAAFVSPVARDGFVDEIGEIWSADGQLLVQSRQISLMMPLPDLGEREPMRFVQP